MPKTKLKHTARIQCVMTEAYIPKGSMVEVVGIPTEAGLICIRYEGYNYMIKVECLEGNFNDK